MAEASIPESEVQVIKTAILGFIDDMKEDKRVVEQNITDRSENLRSSLLGSGGSQFSYQEVDDLSRNYKDEFLNIYRNTIHLKIIASASSKIKKAIEDGLIDANVVQEEWLEGFKHLQDQINQYQQIADKAEMLESELEGSIVNQEDIQELRKQLAEKEQLITEKDQEIENLNEGLSKMESQMNSLGQNMLENSMTIEELQEAINDRDEEISRLKDELKSKEGSSAEIEILQQQLKEAKERERELQQELSSASTDLVSQLQNDLEETRNQVITLRREVVQKNEDMHALKIEQDESLGKINQLEEDIEEIKEERDNLEQSRKQLTTELDELKSKNTRLTNDLAEKNVELSEFKTKLDTTNKKLTDLQEELSTYEGKVAMSKEEKQRISSEMQNLKEQLAMYEEAMVYLKQVLEADIKFRILVVLASMSNGIRIDDLANAVGAPESVTQRAVIELAEYNIIEANKEGRNLYCKLDEKLNPPLVLSTD